MGGVPHSFDMCSQGTMGIPRPSRRSARGARYAACRAAAVAAATSALLGLAVAPAVAQPPPAGPADASPPERLVTPAKPGDRVVPGFSVLDSSMMSVEHDSPVHGTAITLFSTLRRDDLMPRDIGVDFLPFLSPPLGSDTSPEAQLERLNVTSVGRSMKQYLSASIAISQDVDLKVEGDSLSRLAIGVRTFIVAGRLNCATLTLMEDYVHASTKYRELEARRPSTPSADWDEEFATQFLLVRALAEQAAGASRQRVGWLVETGTALALDVPDNTLSNASVGRYAYWMTPIYRFDPRPVAVAGLLRVIVEPETQLTRVDVGGRVSVSRRSGIGYSLEAIGRISMRTPEDRYSGRLVGAVAYPFNRSTQLNFTFGKNFENDFSHGGSLLASFGLTIGLGEIPLGKTSERSQ
jgi:hypothetical protein